MLIWGQWVDSNCLCQGFHFHQTPLSPVSGSGDVKYVMHSHSVRTDSLFPSRRRRSGCRRMLPFSSELGPVRRILLRHEAGRGSAESCIPTSTPILDDLIHKLWCSPPNKPDTRFPPPAYPKVCFPSSALGVVFGCILTCNVTPCRSCPFRAVWRSALESRIQTLAVVGRGRSCLRSALRGLPLFGPPGYEVTNPANLQGVVLTKTHKHAAVNLVGWLLIKCAGTQDGQRVRWVCIAVEPELLADRWLSEFQGFPLLWLCCCCAERSSMVVGVCDVWKVSFEPRLPLDPLPYYTVLTLPLSSIHLCIDSLRFISIL